jgi:hypothetical protein
MGTTERRMVSMEIEDQIYALGDVEVSLNDEPAERREENVLFGRIALDVILERYPGPRKMTSCDARSPYLRLYKPQEWFLRIVTTIAKVQCDGKRDEIYETAIIAAWLRHNGIDAMVRYLERARAA